MAGDWIKWVKGLTRRSEVLKMASILKRGRHDIAARCMELWEWADSETTDGFVAGATKPFIDDLVSCAGFFDAMIEVRWIAKERSGIRFANFAKNNGATAKARAEGAVRQQVCRAKRSDEGSVRDHISAATKRAAWKRTNGHCAYCKWDLKKKSPPYGEMIGVVASYDHVIPVCQGGTSTGTNIVLACSKCNQEKSGRTPEQAGMRHEIVTDICDKSVTREEKRREEKAAAGNPTAAHPQPDPDPHAPPAAAVSNWAGEKAVRDVLIQAGIGEPTLTTLARSGLNVSAAKKAIEGWKLTSKGVGILVNTLRGEAARCRTEKAERDELQRWRSMPPPDRVRILDAFRESCPASWSHVTPTAMEQSSQFRKWLAENKPQAAVEVVIESVGATQGAA